jgi:drug/metabolite transporter (DMT)-like permease
LAWAVIAGVSFGLSQLFNRGLNREIDAVRAATAMVTSLLGFLFVALVVTGEITALPDITALAVLWFVAAGLMHFLVGWTFFAFSQQRVGTSRTAAILSANPVLAAIIAWLVLSESLRAITWVGVLAVTIGVAIITTARLTTGRWTNPSLALIATLCFSISPIFVRWGLDEFDYPLLGLAVGMTFTVPAMHVVSRIYTGKWVSVPHGVRRWLLGGGMSALAMTAQWTAFASIPIGVALSLQQLQTPVVLIFGPMVLSAPNERATPRLVAGTAMVVAGSVLVALFGRSL